MIRLTRRYGFCASHRLHSDRLTEEANREVYGKCNNPHGHGHNYSLEITVVGILDRNTGVLMRPGHLDAYVDEYVLRNLDHRHLNDDVAEFSALVPTSENLARVIENRLNEGWSGRFPAGPRLEKVRLQETRRNRFELST
jgi:6-pyruvoyltetrahydropterin/6-carboxytetrahydropterin synthase